MQNFSVIFSKNINVLLYQQQSFIRVIEILSKNNRSIKNEKERIELFLAETYRLNKIIR